MENTSRKLIRERILALNSTESVTCIDWGRKNGYLNPFAKTNLARLDPERVIDWWERKVLYLERREYIPRRKQRFYRDYGEGVLQCRYFQRLTRCLTTLTLTKNSRVRFLNNEFGCPCGVWDRLWFKKDIKNCQTFAALTEAFGRIL